MTGGKFSSVRKEVADKLGDVFGLADLFEWVAFGSGFATFFISQEWGGETGVC